MKVILIPITATNSILETLLLKKIPVGYMDNYSFCHEVLQFDSCMKLEQRHHIELSLTS